MDPLSVTASCISLTATVTKCAINLTAFIQEVRGAKGDLNRIAAELESLTSILQLLRDDVRRMSRDSLPPSILNQLYLSIDQCKSVVLEIENSIGKHRNHSLGVATYWTIMGGKEDMAKLRSNLEAHKSTIKLGCDIVHFSVMLDIKNDTRRIQNQTAAIPAIKNDTEQIRDQIARLRRRLGPPSESGINIPLHRFLEESEAYTEELYEQSIRGEGGLESRLQSPRSSMRRSVPRPRHDSQQLGSSNNEGPVDPFNYVPDTSRAQRRLRNPRTRSDSHRSSSSTNAQAFSEYTVTSRSTFDESIEAYYTSTSSQRNNIPQPHRHHSQPLQSGEHARHFTDATINRLSAHVVPLFSHLQPGPTSLRDFQNHLRRPDDWHWLTVHHAFSTEPTSTHPATEFASHRYTCMTRGPSYLARLGFKLRQRQEYSDRETMLLICVYMPDIPVEQGHDAAARFMTTIESVIEALRTADGACDPSPTHCPWWTKVVICMLHSKTTTIYEHGLGADGMQLRCDSHSEHCGIAPQSVTDDDDKIYAHLWEHTTSRTQFSWDWRGTPELPTQGNIPLQLIQCQFTSKAGPLTEPSGKAHIESFITMLDARSCISIAAGQTIDKYDVLNAYNAARRKRGAKTVEELRGYPKGMRMDAFQHVYANVPTRVYMFDETLKFDKGRKPFKMNWLS